MTVYETARHYFIMIFLVIYDEIVSSQNKWFLVVTSRDVCVCLLKKERKVHFAPSLVTKFF